MKVRHAPGNALHGYGTVAGTVQGPTLGYHDPVYDVTGGQGVAVVYSGESQPNPGALILIVGIIAFLLLMGDE